MQQEHVELSHLCRPTVGSSGPFTPLYAVRNFVPFFLDIYHADVSVQVIQSRGVQPDQCAMQPAAVNRTSSIVSKHYNGHPAEHDCTLCKLQPLIMCCTAVAASSDMAPDAALGAAELVL